MDTTNTHRQFWAWIFVLIICLVLYCFICSAQNRTLAAEEYKQKNIVIVRGTVLHADCTFDPTTQAIHCSNLAVTYADKHGNDVTRTFSYEGTAENIQKVPQIGMSVLVSYTRTDPETAYVMAIE